jgi:hypothetical protein
VYLLGHIGCVLFLNFLVERYFEFELKYKKLVLAIATMTPDLVDKPIGGLLLGQGRWITHSFVVQTIAFLLIMGIYHYSSLSIQNGEKYILIYYLGMAAHLIFDQPSLGMTTMFWPFFGDFPHGPKNGFLLGFSNPTVVLTELLGLVLLITIGLAEKWERKYWIYLFVFVISYILTFSLAYVILVGQLASILGSNN